MFTFICFKYSTLNFQDEWVGRGLYPGLAFFHGLDFMNHKLDLTYLFMGGQLDYSIRCAVLQILQIKLSA